MWSPDLKPIVKTNILSMKHRYLLCASAAAWALTLPAQAIVIGGSVTGGVGSFVQLTVPLTGSTPANTVGADTFDRPNLYAFNESQNAVVAAGGLSVDYVPGGGTGTIAAGTIVASHYVFFDPDGASSQRGYVDFDANILGIVSSTARLSASDYLANTGVTYLNPGLRGLEAGDSAIIDSLVPSRVRVDWSASSPGDYVRVLTAYSPGAPVPDGGSSVMLLGMGALGLAGLLRRKV